MLQRFPRHQQDYLYFYNIKLYIYMNLWLNQRSCGDMHRWHELRIKNLKKGKKLVVVWIGAGCGLDPGLDRPRSKPIYLKLLQLGCSMTKKGRQGGQAASVQLGRLALCQACNLIAWMLNSCSLAAWQLASETLPQFIAWLLSIATKQKTQKYQFTNTLYYSKNLQILSKILDKKSRIN